MGQNGQGARSTLGAGASEHGALGQKEAAGLGKHRLTGPTLDFYRTLRNTYYMYHMLQLGGGHPNTSPRTLEWAVSLGEQGVRMCRDLAGS